MAIVTQAYTLTNAAWTALNDGTEGTMLLQADGNIRLYAGASSPALSEPGMLLDEWVWFSFQGLETGDYVYARAAGADNTNQSRTITVRVLRK